MILWKGSPNRHAVWPMYFLALVPILLSGCGGGGGGDPAVSPQLPRCTISDIGPPGGSSTANDINCSGQIVGIAGETDLDPVSEEGFLWENGSVTNLGTLAARAINDSGEVVGDSEGVAYLWVDIDRAELLANGIAHGINEMGQVVGEASATEGFLHAFLWDDGTITDLGTLGGQWSVAYGINAAGDVAGWAETGSGRLCAALWQNGVATDLGTLGGDRSMAYALNDAGQVVGYSETSAGIDRAFLWQDGAMLGLGDLGGYSVAYDVDNRGRVVGESGTQGGETHAFLWREGAMTDLNDFVSPASGWTLTRALAINDRGQVVGQGIHKGARRAFLLQIP